MNLKYRVPNYIELNWIRGLAAIFVVLFHYTTRYDEIFGHELPWKINVPWGGSMVMTFFLLSGFLAVLTLKENQKPIQYLQKRFRRLYPIYWMCMAVTIVVMLWAFPLYEELPDSSLKLKDILVNITMLQGFFRVPAVDGAYWTLAVELRFYLFIFVLLIIRQCNKMKAYAYYWIIGSIALQVLKETGLRNPCLAIANYLFIPRYCAAFASGIFLAFYAKEKKRTNLLGVLLSILLALLSFEFYEIITMHIVLCLILVSISLRNSSRYGQRYEALLEKADSDGLLYLNKIAAISYPLYLLHQHIGYAILWRLEQIGCGNEIFVLVPLITCLILAAIIQKIDTHMLPLLIKT